MYYIIKIDGFLVSAIDTTNKPNKYGNKLYFRSRKAAQAWIDKRSYTGMSYKYEIRKEVK